MYARHVTVRGNPAHVDEVVRTQQEVVVPVLRGCTGFVAQLVLLDRAEGEAIGISLWDSEENMEASEEKVRVADALHSADPPKVQLYEVAIFEQG